MCHDNAEKVFKTCDNLAETKNDKFSRRIGEKCLETTIRAKEDYTNNLYDWNTSKKELQKGSRTKGNNIRLTGNRKRFAIEELKAKIKKKDEIKTHWIE